MKKLFVACGLLAALIVPVTAQGAATITRITFEDDIDLCNGETLHLSGPVLIVENETTTPSGGFITHFRAGPQGISAVASDGTVFHATGVTKDSFVTTPAGGSTETFINRFHIQATRGAQSFDITETFHITVTPAGAVTAEVDMSSSTC
jgi:hypothetical protein